MFGLGAGELLIIFVFALLFIGPKKLPELAKGLGKSLREFQKAKDDLMADINNPSDDEPAPKVTEDQSKKSAEENTSDDPQQV